MEEKYDLGTPLCGERKSRRLQSPLQEMDGVVTQLFCDDAPVPQTPSDAQPVTMAGIAAVLAATLDEKLAPMSQNISRLESQVGDLKKQVTENEDMMNVNMENMTKRMDAMEEDVKQHKAFLAASALSTPRVSRGDSSEDNHVAVFGGFKGAGSKKEVDEWLWDVLWKAGAAEPVETYIKGDMGDYNGLVFGKYNSKAERDTAVNMTQRSEQEYDGHRIWSKIDLPLKVRVCQNILFGAKRLLVDWGFDRKGLWADMDEQTLTCGSDVILSLDVSDGLVLKYGEGWEAYMSQDDDTWKKMVQVAQQKLSRGQKPTKGVGKGKRKE